MRFVAGFWDMPKAATILPLQRGHLVTIQIGLQS